MEEERLQGGPLIWDLLCLGEPKDPVLPAKRVKWQYISIENSGVL